MKLRLNREIGSRVVEALLIRQDNGKYSVIFNGVVLENIRSITHAKVEAELLMNEWALKLDKEVKVA